MQPAINFERLIEIIQMDTNALRAYLVRFLESNEYEVRTDNDNYVIGIPSTVRDAAHPRVCFVAHIDVVDNRVGPRIVMKGVELKNTAGGCLGADDRAGVFAIIENIEKAKYKPCVIFCNYEETGGVGVRKLCKDDAFAPWAKYVDVFIEPDRKGGDEYVWYSNTMPKPMHAWLQRFGYKPDNGSFSDVKILTEQYKKPHANISVGYRAQHTANETLNILELAFTVRNMGQMLHSKPPVHIMTESEITYSWGGSSAYGGRNQHYPNSQASKSTTSGTKATTGTKTAGFSKTYSTLDEYKNCKERPAYFAKLAAEKNKAPAAAADSNILVIGEKHPGQWSPEEWARVADFISGKTAVETETKDTRTKQDIRTELASKTSMEIARVLVENYTDDRYFDARVDLGAGASADAASSTLV